MAYSKPLSLGDQVFLANCLARDKQGYIETTHMRYFMAVRGAEVVRNKERLQLPKTPHAVKNDVGGLNVYQVHPFYVNF